MAYQPKSYRKFLATGVATAMVATTVAPAVSADQHTDFTDIEDVRSWAGDAIDYLVEKGAIQGMGTPGIFNPQGELTRGQAASLLANTLGLDVDEDATSGFDDLAGHWSDAYVAAIQAELPGVIDGYTDGTFRPENDITRQEMAKITVEAFDLEVNADADVDFEDNNSWGAEYVEVLASLGILGGYTDGTIRPEADITRAEAAVFVHRTEVPSVRLGQDEVAELAVESVSAINATTIEVTFNNGETETFTVDALTPNREVERTIEYMDEEFTVTVTYVLEEQIVLRDEDGNIIEQVDVFANQSESTVRTAFVNSTAQAISTNDVEFLLYNADGEEVDRETNTNGPLLRADRTTALPTYTLPSDLGAGEYELFVAITNNSDEVIFSQELPVVANAVGLYDEDEEEYVAYASLQDALDDAEDEGQVKLYDDVEEDVVIENDELELDLNGYTIDGDVTIDAEDVEIKGSTITGDVIVRANASVDLTTVTIEGDVVLEAASSRAVNGDREGSTLRPYLDEDVTEVSNYVQLVQALSDDAENIVLTSDIELTSNLVINQEVNIDFGGYTVSADSTDREIHVNHDDVTLMNGTIDGDTGNNINLVVAAGADVEDVNIQELDFVGATMSVEVGNAGNYSAKNVTFEDVDFEVANLSVFGESSDDMSENISFVDAEVEGTLDISDDNVKGLSFENADLEGAGALTVGAEDASFENVQFGSNDVTLATAGAVLSNVEFDGGNLIVDENAHLEDAEFADDGTITANATLRTAGTIGVAPRRSLTLEGNGVIRGDATFEGPEVLITTAAGQLAISGGVTFADFVEITLSTDDLVLRNVTFENDVEINGDAGADIVIPNGGYAAFEGDVEVQDSDVSFVAKTEAGIAADNFTVEGTLRGGTFLSDDNDRDVSFGDNLLVRDVVFTEDLGDLTFEDVKLYESTIETDEDVTVDGESVFENVEWTEDTSVDVTGELALRGDIGNESVITVSGLLDVDASLENTIDIDSLEMTQAVSESDAAADLVFTFDLEGFEIYDTIAATLEADTGALINITDSAADFSGATGADVTGVTTDDGALTFNIVTGVASGDAISESLTLTLNGAFNASSLDEDDTVTFTLTIAGVSQTVEVTVQ